MIEQAITGKQKLEMTYLKANDSKSKHGIIPLAAGEEDYQGKIPRHVGLLRQTQGRTYVQCCPYSGIETSMMQMSAIPIAFMRGFYAERAVIIVVARARVERVAEQSNNEPLTILLTPAKWLRGGQNKQYSALSIVQINYLRWSLQIQ